MRVLIAASLLIATAAVAKPKPASSATNWVPAEVLADWKDPERGHNTQGSLYQGGALETALFRGRPADLATAGTRLDGLALGGRAVTITVISATPAAPEVGPADAPPLTLYELRDAKGKNPCAGRAYAGKPNDATWKGKAVAVPGAWGKGGVRVEPGAQAPFMTLSCFDGAIAKCVAWGYRADIDPKKLALHQACVRMARADYCGTGRAFTCEGTDIDVVDGAGIQKRGAQSAADKARERIEADWSPEGATCLGFARLPGCGSKQARLKALIEKRCKDAGHPIRLNGCDDACQVGAPGCATLRSYATPGTGKVCQRAVESCGAK